MKKLETMTFEELGLRLYLSEKHKVHAFLHHPSAYHCIQERYLLVKRMYDRRLYGR